MRCDRESFVIGVFDTTYSCNGFASYKEGILFARHLIDLVAKDKDIQILFKEKKDRKFQRLMDPVSAPDLLSVYDEMDKHPRIKVLSRFANTGEIMDSSDFVVSFPFTSTTFEALSRRIPAIWHDPMQCYKDTVYGKLGGVMSHGFDQLWDIVQFVKLYSSEKFFLSLDLSSDLMDPFQDRKSVDRFRQLLCDATYSRHD